MQMESSCSAELNNMLKYNKQKYINFTFNIFLTIKYVGPEFLTIEGLHQNDTNAVNLLHESLGKTYISYTAANRGAYFDVSTIGIPVKTDAIHWNN